jgi:hypothetical protein
LTQARNAVWALRGDAVPTVSELQSLIENFRDDMHVDVTLSVDGDCRSLFPALQAGARGYPTKDASAEEIEHAIPALVAGQTHLDPAVQQRLLTAVLETAPASSPEGELPDDLTADAISFSTSTSMRGPAGACQCRCFAFGLGFRIVKRPEVALTWSNPSLTRTRTRADFEWVK